MTQSRTITEDPTSDLPLPPAPATPAPAARAPAAASAPAVPSRGAPKPPQSGYSRAALVLILAASFMVVLDFSIVNVALASIQRELGFAASAAQWVVTGYAITFGGLLILGGRAADLFGRRRMFVTGLIVFYRRLAGRRPGARSRCCWSRRARCRAWARPWSPRPPCP